MASGGMKKADLQEVVDEIIGLGPKMRFVAVIDLRGNIVEGIMKDGKTSLESQKEQEHFCRQIAKRRSMRKEFDKSLGKVKYVHVERENVTQLVVYTSRHTIFLTTEPDLSISKKLQIVTTVKSLVGNI